MKKASPLVDLCYPSTQGSADKEILRSKQMMAQDLVKNQCVQLHNDKVERVSTQPLVFQAATTLHADDPDSAGGGSSKPAGSATPRLAQLCWLPRLAVHAVRLSFQPFADSAADPSPFLSSITGGPSPSNVSTDQIPIAVLFESTSGDLNEFFLEMIRKSRLGFVLVDKQPDGRLVDHNGENSGEVLYLRERVAPHGLSRGSPSLRRQMNSIPFDKNPELNLKLYPKSSVMPECDEMGNCVYVFGTSLSYPATLLERKFTPQAHSSPSELSGRCCCSEYHSERSLVGLKASIGEPFSNPLRLQLPKTGCIPFSVPVVLDVLLLFLFCCLYVMLVYIVSAGICYASDSFVLADFTYILLLTFVSSAALNPP
ncbi:hypothetical protein Tco_0533249 [Tanacetum coccineum]